jgi:beta-glucosidase
VSSETIVLRLGETAVMSGEGASRAFPNVPDEQINLANRILALGRPTVVLLYCGRPLVAPSLLGTKAAVLVCWFPGSAGAAAVCDVLSGRAEPEGRLPVSWPATIGQIPVHYASRPVGRPEDPGDRFTSRYIDVSAAPRFWFGHGLGFSRFTLDSLRVLPELVGLSDCFHVMARVRNVGTRGGRTVVFVFIRDRIACVARPLRELRGMIPIALEPGGVADVELKLMAAELAPLGGPSVGLPEAGDFDVLAGFSAEPSGLAEARLRVREPQSGASHHTGQHDDDA